MPTPITAESHLSLFSPSVQEKPRFMALAAAVLSQAEDMIALIQTGFPEAHDLETANGTGLDALGALVNVSRPSASTSDADYRYLLRACIAGQRWNGTNETLPAVLEAAFPDQNAQLIDNQDGTVTVSLSGETPFPPEVLFPLPAGIRMISASESA